MALRISSAVTYRSTCAHSLLSILRRSLERRPHRPSLSNPILLFSFAPSSTTSPEILSNITSTLTQHYPEHVGCVSAPLPLQFIDPRLPSNPNSCSLACAFVDGGVSFRSTIPGRAEPRTGRWHAARGKSSEDLEGTLCRTLDARMQTLISETDDKVDWERIWDNNNTTTPVANSLLSHESNLFPEMLSDELLHINPSTIVYFSDKAPQGLESVLQSAFPRADKVSLIASSTPFVTGRPVTLFHNGSIWSDGAVGVAFTSSVSSPPAVVEFSFPPLVEMTHNLNITSSEGNLILSLDSGNPSQLILNAIRKHNLSSAHTTTVGKEDEFYVGVVDPSSQQILQLHRISGGDPSRGSIALDATSAPREGSIIRLYHLPKESAAGALTSAPDIIRDSISLIVAPEMTSTVGVGTEIANSPAGDDSNTIVLDAFLAASENGFTASNSTQGPWKCVVPGGRLRMSSL